MCDSCYEPSPIVATERMSTQPADHLARQRFNSELGINFSLECPAGSGKTHSITERIMTMAEQPNAVDLLSKLVVVTFTEASAAEMFTRARQALKARGCPLRVQQAFDSAYFGTIHSFATRILRTHGHHVGLANDFEIAESLDPLWDRFVRTLSPAALKDSHTVLRHCPIQKLLRLVYRWDSNRTPPVQQMVELPVFDFTPIYECELPKNKRSIASIQRYQSALRQFEQVLRGEAEVDFMVLPRPTAGGAEFIALAGEVVRPVANWINAQIAELAYHLSCEFRAYRVSAGQLCFDDLIYYARGLLSTEPAQSEIRRLDYSILLDEAQDTDPYQFDFLLELCRPVGTTGSWREAGAPAIEGGRFSMVGDPQQSIYSSRADLGTYRQAIQYIANSDKGDRIGFEVTFRCDRKIVQLVNNCFSTLFDGQSGQVSYVSLQSRQDAGTGETYRLAIDTGAQSVATADEACRVEGQAIAAALMAMRERGTFKQWNEVALICPRKNWFSPLADGLLEAGIPSSFLSSHKRYGDFLAWCWVTAFCRILTRPVDAYETVGILRDIYGFSDAELFDFSQGKSGAFLLYPQKTEKHPVGQALNYLMRLRAACLQSTLIEGVTQICGEIETRLIGHPEELKMLGSVKTLAARFDWEGRSLTDFTQTLFDKLQQPVALNGDSGDRVQLITDLKSKGLQWSVVVIPTFFRSLFTPHSEYPKLIGERTGPALISSDRSDCSAVESLRQEREIRHEQERRAYVSLTRAKHCLLICDDQKLFEPFQRTHLPNGAEWLGVDSQGRLEKVWSGIPYFTFD